MVAETGTSIALAPRPRSPRLLAGALISLAAVLAAIVFGALYAAQVAAKAAAAPLPLYTDAGCTDDLGPDLATYTTPDPYATVLRYYHRRFTGSGSKAASRSVPFAGEVEQLYLTPTPRDAAMDQALFLHRAARVTTWTLIARARNGSRTRILTGRVADLQPPNVQMLVNASGLSEPWPPLPWNTSGGPVLLGGAAAGTCSRPFAFDELWRAHAALVSGPLNYRPAVSSATVAPASPNGAARPGVYWAGDESDGLRLAAFERFDPTETMLAFLCATPGKEKRTRLFLVKLLN